MADITATELNERLKQGESLAMLDVRGQLEYNTFNIGGQNIPLPQLPAALDDLDWDKADEIIVLCKAGLRSGTAQHILQQNGYQNVKNLLGGLMALQKLNNTY